jgi:hypothetical protein
VRGWKIIFAIFTMASSGFGGPVAARKPPLSIDAPSDARRYWTLRVRFDRGELEILRVRRKVVPRGRTKRIYEMAGPFEVVLLAAGGQELARHAFSFPLCGPGELDPRITKGLTADATVVVPHVAGLRVLRVQGPDGKPRVDKKARWPGERAVPISAPGPAAATGSRGAAER